MLMFELDLHFKMGNIYEHQILHMNKYLIPWLWWLIVRMSPFWNTPQTAGEVLTFGSQLQLVTVLRAYKELSSCVTHFHQLVPFSFL